MQEFGLVGERERLRDEGRLTLEQEKVLDNKIGQARAHLSYERVKLEMGIFLASRLEDIAAQSMMVIELDAMQRGVLPTLILDWDYINFVCQRYKVAMDAIKHRYELTKKAENTQALMKNKNNV